MNIENGGLEMLRQNCIQVESVITIRTFIPGLTSVGWGSDKENSPHVKFPWNLRLLLMTYSTSFKSRLLYNSRIAEAVNEIIEEAVGTLEEVGQLHMLVWARKLLFNEANAWQKISRNTLADNWTEIKLLSNLIFFVSFGISMNKKTNSFAKRNSRLSHETSEITNTKTKTNES